MYEDRGYCPANAFDRVALIRSGAGRLSEHWDEVRDMLGKRTLYMVYPELLGEYMIFDVLMSGIMGIKIATALQVMMPVCVYPVIGSPIVIHDHYSSDAPKYDITVNTSIAEFQDERYFVVIEDDGEEINMHIYKK